MSDNPIGLAGLTKGSQTTPEPTTRDATPAPADRLPPAQGDGGDKRVRASFSGADAAAKSWPVRFTGSGSEYFRIWIVNLLLMIVTLTLYYPWAKVRKLRYFYGNTQVAGHALDFHGEPMRMLRGYLLLVALFFVYNLAFNVSATGAIAALVIMAAIWPVLFRTSMRFRLANTSWRGLRFAFVGDTAGAYKALIPAFVPAILIFLALAVFGPETPEAGAKASPAAKAAADQFGTVFLGITLLAMLAVPLMWWALKRYQHNHYQLAQERTAFSAGLGSFYATYGKAVGLVLLPLVLFGFVAGLMSSGLRSSASGAMLYLMGGVFFVFILLYVAAILVIQPYLAARLQNLVWNRTASTAIGFKSALRARDLLGLNLKNWLLTLVTLGLYWPFAAVAIARLKLEAVTVVAKGNLDDLVTAQRHRMKDATGDAAADVFDVDLGM